LDGRTFEVKPGAESVRTRVRSFADPRLREALESRRDEELRQAVFRVRPLSVQQPSPEQGDLFEVAQTASQTRARATIYIFSSVPLRGLTVSLQHRVSSDSVSRDHQVVVRLRQPASTSAVSEQTDLPRKPLRGATPPAHGPPDGFAGLMLTS
jgi:hypothetical protein